MMTRARAEWEKLRRAAIHRPGIEMWFGLLAPYASLYERPFNHCEALSEHEKLEYQLGHEFKIEVIRFKEKLLELADKDPKVRDRLTAIATANVEFAGNRIEVDHARSQMSESASILGPEHFFNLLLLNPELHFGKGRGVRAVYLDTTVRMPLANLYFMRDQQAVTDKGMFLSRMSKPQRRGETKLTRLLWESLGETITHEVHAPGLFEGGDFFPMKDFALVGLGDRTNSSGVKQMLKHGLGFDEVGVVHHPRHPLVQEEDGDPMLNMHLDTYFNVASSGVVVGSALLLRRARVEVYQREGDNLYKKSKQETNLYDYVREKGFSIIDLTTLEQMCYASDFLCIKDGTILTIEVGRIAKIVLQNLESETKRDPYRYGQLLEQVRSDYQRLQNDRGFFPHKREIHHYGIDVSTILLTNLTGGYGGVHCMTAALQRG
jgi:arginine deiminase